MRALYADRFAKLSSIEPAIERLNFPKGSKSGTLIDTTRFVSLDGDWLDCAWRGDSAPENALIGAVIRIVMAMPSTT